MLSAFSKRIVDLESQCLLMQRHLNDLRAKFVNSFLSDEELETGKATLKSTILRLHTELQQQTHVLDESRAQVALQGECLDQLRTELNNINNGQCVSAGTMEKAFTEATDKSGGVFTDDSDNLQEQYEEQQLENKGGPLEAWQLPRSPFHLTFSQELQGFNQQGDSVETPQTSIQLPRSTRPALRYQPEDFSTNQNNNEPSPSPPPVKMQRLSGVDEGPRVSDPLSPRAQQTLRPSPPLSAKKSFLDHTAFFDNTNFMVTYSRMEAWLQHLLELIKDRNIQVT